MMSNIIKALLKWNILTILLIYIPFNLIAAGVIYHYESGQEVDGSNMTLSQGLMNEGTLEKKNANDSIMLAEGTRKRAETNRIKWSYLDYLFFVLATHSCMSYSSLIPETHEGRIWVIIFSCLGIPLSTIIYAHLGEFIHSRFSRTSRLKCILYHALCLIPFILIPSLIFMEVENWPFSEGVYYSFVSLATIGYGDSVKGVVPLTSFAGIVYRIFHIMWLILGIGFIAYLLKYMSNLLRELLNKLTLRKGMIIKSSKKYKIKRVQSCPNLSEWRDGKANWTQQNEGIKGNSLSEVKKERIKLRLRQGLSNPQLTHSPALNVLYK